MVSKAKSDDWWKKKDILRRGVDWENVKNISDTFKVGNRVLVIDLRRSRLFTKKKGKYMRRDRLFMDIRFKDGYVRILKINPKNGQIALDDGSTIPWWRLR